MTGLAFPKPEPRGPKPSRFLPRIKHTPRGTLVRQLDDTCKRLVKALAMNRCECCGKRPTETDVLDWAHGDGRAQTWALRWARSNTFALLRSCHRRFERNRELFAAWRKSMLSEPAWAHAQATEATNPKVGVLQLEVILAELRRGCFVQGDRL